LTGVINGDDVSLGVANAVFANPAVGTGKNVQTGYALSGTKSANYQVIQPTGLTASITPAGLSITGVAVESKNYDGNTAAVIKGGTLVGVLGDAEATDDVSLAANPTGTFASKEVGTWGVTANLALIGADAGNYTLIQPTGLSGTITAGTSLAGWGSSFGLTGANAAAGADPDGDGWSNALEYAFGLNPTNAGGTLAMLSQESNQVKLTFLQKDTGGITYAVKSATSLSTGFSNSITPQLSTNTNGVPAGYKRYEATLPTTNARGFLKVEATIP
jgi:hypothetical protein